MLEAVNPLLALIPLTPLENTQIIRREHNTNLKTKKRGEKGKEKKKKRKSRTQRQTSWRCFRRCWRNSPQCPTCEHGTARHLVATHVFGSFALSPTKHMHITNSLSFGIHARTTHHMHMHITNSHYIRNVVVCSDLVQLQSAIAIKRWRERRERGEQREKRKERKEEQGEKRMGRRKKGEKKRKKEKEERDLHLIKEVFRGVNQLKLGPEIFLSSFSHWQIQNP